MNFSFRRDRKHCHLSSSMSATVVLRALDGSTSTAGLHHMVRPGRPGSTVDSVERDRTTVLPGNALSRCCRLNRFGPTRMPAPESAAGGKSLQRVGQTCGPLSERPRWTQADHHYLAIPLGCGRDPCRSPAHSNEGRGPTLVWPGHRTLLVMDGGGRSSTRERKPSCSSSNAEDVSRSKSGFSLLHSLSDWWSGAQQRWRSFLCAFSSRP